MNKYLVGCIPVEAHPSHPTDQSPCIQVPCPSCKGLMWYSQKKRELLKREPYKYEIICLKCAAFLHYLSGYKPGEVEMIDIDKSGGIH